MKINPEYLLDKKQKQPKPPEFVVLNEYCQCYSGLRGGYPVFSDNMDDARTLNNIEQFKKVQYGTHLKVVTTYQ